VKGGDALFQMTLGRLVRNDAIIARVYWKADASERRRIVISALLTRIDMQTLASSVLDNLM